MYRGHKYHVFGSASYKLCPYMYLLRGLVRWMDIRPVLGSMPGLSFFTIYFFSLVFVLPTLGLHQSFMVYRVLGGGGFLVYSNDSLLRDFSSFFDFGAYSRLYRLSSATLPLAPFVSSGACSWPYYLFSTLSPVLSFHALSLACPQLCRLSWALAPVVGFTIRP